MTKEKIETKTESSGEDQAKPKPKNRPSVAYLLAHGDPETANLPKTWKDILGFPLVLSLVFFLSLLTFHYAPHSKSTRPKFELPQRNQPIFDQGTVVKEPKQGEPAMMTDSDPEPVTLELIVEPEQEGDVKEKPKSEEEEMLDQEPPQEQEVKSEAEL